MATGRAARERVERARAVSALIDTEAAARDAFDGAYTGRGAATDALAALLRGDVADPERNARLDRHRRSAFARPDGPAAEAAAAVALVALRREVESAGADSAALDRAIAVVLERDAEGRAASGAAAESAAAATAEDRSTVGAPTSPAVAPVSRQFPRWVRPALAVVVIVAAIAVGAGGDNLIAGAPPAPVDAGPSPITYFRDPAVRDGEATGDISPADRWFRGEQTAEDAYPLPFEGIDPESTRLVHTGTDGRRVWVGRTLNADFCLLSYSGQDGSGGSSCIGAEDFAQAGVTMGTGNITVTWTGAELTLQISRD
ncbi:hypothetical protein ABIB15_001833 [Marisediminicola sp. UYEF4]|uniref:hypothetical protein n=1 Tax=Marisediminicola sp. UYEF4 TaxID=1756384 RepID=UPI0033977E15